MLVISIYDNVNNPNSWLLGILTDRKDTYRSRKDTDKSQGYIEKGRSMIRVIYGQELDNNIDIQLPEEDISSKLTKNINNPYKSDRKIVASLAENFKIIPGDILQALTLMNGVIKNNTNTKNINSINGIAIIILDSANQLYYYNLDNLEIIISDMKLNQYCWKNIHNSYLLSLLPNRNRYITPSISITDSSFPLFSQKLNSIFGSNKNNLIKYYSLFDYNISK